MPVVLLVVILRFFASHVLLKVAAFETVGWVTFVCVAASVYDPIIRLVPESTSVILTRFRRVVARLS